MIVESPTIITTKKEVPFVHGLPFIGSQPAVKRDRVSFLTHLMSKGDVYGFYLRSAPYVVVNRPELIHRVLVELSEDFSRAERIRQNLGANGLVKMEGEEHHKQRKVLAPIFHTRYLSRYASIMAHYGEQLCQRWQEGEVIVLNEQMISLSLNILGKILFDLEAIAEEHDLIDAITYIFSYNVGKYFALFDLPASWPTPANVRHHKARKVMLDFVQRMVRNRLGNDGQFTQHDDFLSALLQLTYDDGSKMPMQQVVIECMGFLFGGYDTFSLSLMWVWLLLTKNPMIYQKMQQEIDQVLGGRTPEYSDLERLPYCLQVYKEVIRFYPPAPFNTRTALRDVEIGGYFIPKGTTIAVSPYLMHHRPEYYPDPERFDPERFTPEREKQLPRFAYFPFGGGARTCIASQWAMMQGHLLLATLAQRVTFELLPRQKTGFNLKNSLGLRPAGKLEAVVKRRFP